MEKKPESSGHNDATISLTGYESEEQNIAVIHAQTRSNSVTWAFRVLLVTVAGGLLCYTVLDALGKNPDTLREIIQTAMAGEIGLIAGLFNNSQNQD